MSVANGYSDAHLNVFFVYCILMSYNKKTTLKFNIYIVKHYSIEYIYENTRAVDFL